MTNSVWAIKILSHDPLIPYWYQELIYKHENSSEFTSKGLRIDFSKWFTSFYIFIKIDVTLLKGMDFLQHSSIALR